PAAVFRAAGLDDVAEPASSVLTLIRLLHATPAGADAARSMTAVEQAPTGGDAVYVTVPLPLPHSAFLAMLPIGTTVEMLFPALIRDRRAALFYYGVMAMDAETRGFLAARPTLTRDLARQHAGAVAAFGRSVRVERDRVVVPGGDAAIPAWEGVVGARVSDPPAFVGRLLSARDGRTAYMFDAIAHLDDAHQRFALAQLGRLQRAFTGIDREWSVAATPFSRPMHDAAMMLRLVPLSHAGVAPRGMRRELWKSAFGADELPDNAARAFRRVAHGPPVDAAWLAESIAMTAPPIRRQRYEQFAFGARRFALVDAAVAHDAAVGLRGFNRYPAMMLALERMGVTTPAVYARAARAAQAVARAGGGGRGVTAMAQFQGVLAILDRVARSGRLDTATIERLVSSLCAVAPGGGRYAGRVAAWIDDTLVPALRDALDRPAASAEAIVLTAMADRSPDADGRRFEWEGLRYVVDYTAGDLARFEQVRAKQGGNRLDDVLAVAREVSTLRAASQSLGQVRMRARRLDGLMRGLAAPRDWLNLRGSAPAIQSAALGEVVDHALAEVLLGIVYAPHQGDPSELFAAAANLFHRHDFGAGTTDITDAARARLSWARPRIQDTPGQRTRVSGSLFGIDLALARFALRRLAIDRMPARPRLNQSDREVFIATAALVNPRAITGSALKTIAAALRQGRQHVADARRDGAALVDLARAAGVSAVRRQRLSWLAPRTPGLVEGEFSLVELLRLSGASGSDAVGVISEPLTGCYCLRFPDEAPWEDFSGRPGAGHVAARVPDLMLRLAEILVEIDAPAALLPGVLAYATQDFIDEAWSMHTDDGHALVRQAHALDRPRVEDYVAGVAARGPLRPEARP
ncbi:MAG: hypothetical protein ACRD26_08765, partial [Vicinamibacterales bacterium]